MLFAVLLFNTHSSYVAHANCRLLLFRPQPPELRLHVAATYYIAIFTKPIEVKTGLKLELNINTYLNCVIPPLKASTDSIKVAPPLMVKIFSRWF